MISFRLGRSSLAAILALGSLAIVPAAQAGGTLRAGVGIADATWHVGVGSGQYAAKDPNALQVVAGGEVDPYNHSNTQRKSYGVQSRLTYRALVVEGANGDRIALVKSDSYLAQDYLTRRAAQILESGTSGIRHEDIMLMASHNHGSPYYFTPSWGVWLFQDVFELRAFEYHARQMAAAIEQAAANLVPARMGGTTFTHTIYKGNIAGTTTADDGTPGGYPDQHADFGVSVVRFDDMSNPSAPKPLGVFVNHGQHPESNDGYDLITADFLAPLERMVEAGTGAPMIFGQGDVGSAEGPYFRAGYETLPDGVVRAWAHVGHAQTERGARYLADDVIEAFDAIGNGDPSVLLPMSSDVDVKAGNAWVPGPVSHPYPSVSNCRSESTVEGNPGVPVAGLPDCSRGGSNDRASMVWENLKAHGIPVPESYDAPAFTGVEENMRIHLQAFKIGGVVLASCSCEAQMDLILNLESRLDTVVGNQFDGYDWSTSCTQAIDTSWTCADPYVPGRTWTASDERFKRMRAQVKNSADGWDAPEYAVQANAEPTDTTQIKGNFSSDELVAGDGFTLAIGMGHTGDYNGYTVSYREYMSRDHYRKALTSYGPHTADYMVSRLVRLAREIQGGAEMQAEPLDPLAIADEVRQVAASRALGVASGAAYDAWLAAIPNDIGPAAALTQPTDITRFKAATFAWRGGSNAVDNPNVSVERFVDGAWAPYADQSGQVQTMVTFPKGANAITDTYSGNQAWKWTANFEAFTGFPATHGSTPAGQYRFVVDGLIRQSNANAPYRIESAPFAVAPFSGVVSTAKIGDDLSVSTLTFPKSYTSPFRFVKDDGNATLCKTCSFRPWARSSALVAGSASFTLGDSSVVVVSGTIGSGTLRFAIPSGAVSASIVATDAAGNVGISSFSI